MFNLGIGIERGDITMSAHTHIGYASATVKKYDKQNDEGTAETDVVVPDQLPTNPEVEVLLIVVTLELLLQF
jgi:hypothetical protein